MDLRSASEVELGSGAAGNRVEGARTCLRLAAVSLLGFRVAASRGFLLAVWLRLMGVMHAGMVNGGGGDRLVAVGAPVWSAMEGAWGSSAADAYFLLTAAVLGPRGSVVLVRCHFSSCIFLRLILFLS